MVTTVTTTTVTTIASISSAAGLGLMAVIALIALLIAKELAGAADAGRLSGGPGSGAGSPARAQVLARVLDVGIIPLLLVFGCIVVAKIMEVLAG